MNPAEKAQERRKQIQEMKAKMKKEAKLKEGNGEARRILEEHLENNQREQFDEEIRKRTGREVLDLLLCQNDMGINMFSNIIKNRSLWALQSITKLQIPNLTKEVSDMIKENSRLQDSLYSKIFREVIRQAEKDNQGLAFFETLTKEHICDPFNPLNSVFQPFMDINRMLQSLNRDKENRQILQLLHQLARKMNMKELAAKIKEYSVYRRNQFGWQDDKLSLRDDLSHFKLNFIDYNILHQFANKLQYEKIIPDHPIHISNFPLYCQFNCYRETPIDVALRKFPANQVKQLLKFIESNKYVRLSAGALNNLLQNRHLYKEEEVLQELVMKLLSDKLTKRGVLKEESIGFADWDVVQVEADELLRNIDRKGECPLYKYLSYSKDFRQGLIRRLIIQEMKQEHQQTNYHGLLQLNQAIKQLKKQQKQGCQESIRKYLDKFQNYVRKIFEIALKRAPESILQLLIGSIYSRIFLDCIGNGVFVKRHLVICLIEKQFMKAAGLLLGDTTKLLRSIDLTPQVPLHQVLCLYETKPINIAAYILFGLRRLPKSPASDTLKTCLKDYFTTDELILKAYRVNRNSYRFIFNEIDQIMGEGEAQPFYEKAIEYIFSDNFQMTPSQLFWSLLQTLKERKSLPFFNTLSKSKNTEKVRKIVQHLMPLVNASKLSLDLFQAILPVLSYSTAEPFKYPTHAITKFIKEGKGLALRYLYLYHVQFDNGSLEVQEMCRRAATPKNIDKLKPVLNQLKDQSKYFKKTKVIIWDHTDNEIANQVKLLSQLGIVCRVFKLKDKKNKEKYKKLATSKDVSDRILLSLLFDGWTFSEAIFSSGLVSVKEFSQIISNTRILKMVFDKEKMRRMESPSMLLEGFSLNKDISWYNWQKYILMISQAESRLKETTKDEDIWRPQEFMRIQINEPKLISRYFTKELVLQCLENFTKNCKIYNEAMKMQEIRKLALAVDQADSHELTEIQKNQKFQKNLKNRPAGGQEMPSINDYDLLMQQLGPQMRDKLQDVYSPIIREVFNVISSNAEYINGWLLDHLTNELVYVYNQTSVWQVLRKLLKKVKIDRMETIMLSLIKNRHMQQSGFIQLHSLVSEIGALSSATYLKIVHLVHETKSSHYSSNFTSELLRKKIMVKQPQLAYEHLKYFISKNILKNYEYFIELHSASYFRGHPETVITTRFLSGSKTLSRIIHNRKIYTFDQQFYETQLDEEVFKKYVTTVVNLTKMFQEAKPKINDEILFLDLNKKLKESYTNMIKNAKYGKALLLLHEAIRVKLNIENWAKETFENIQEIPLKNQEYEKIKSTMLPLLVNEVKTLTGQQMCKFYKIQNSIAAKIPVQSLTTDNYADLLKMGYKDKNIINMMSKVTGQLNVQAIQSIIVLAIKQFLPIRQAADKMNHHLDLISVIEFFRKKVGQDVLQKNFQNTVVIYNKKGKMTNKEQKPSKLKVLRRVMLIFMQWQHQVTVLFRNLDVCATSRSMFTSKQVTNVDNWLTVEPTLFKGNSKQLIFKSMVLRYGSSQLQIGLMKKGYLTEEDGKFVLLSGNFELLKEFVKQKGRDSVFGRESQLNYNPLLAILLSLNNQSFIINVSRQYQLDQALLRVVKPDSWLEICLLTNKLRLIDYLVSSPNFRIHWQQLNNDSCYSKIKQLAIQFHFYEYNYIVRMMGGDTVSIEQSSRFMHIEQRQKAIKSTQHLTEFNKDLRFLDFVCSIQNSLDLHKYYVNLILCKAQVKLPALSKNFLRVLHVVIFGYRQHEAHKDRPNGVIGIEMAPLMVAALLFKRQPDAFKDLQGQYASECKIIEKLSEFVNFPVQLLDRSEELTEKASLCQAFIRYKTSTLISSILWKYFPNQLLQSRNLYEYFILNMESFIIWLPQIIKNNPAVVRQLIAMLIEQADNCRHQYIIVLLVIASTNDNLQEEDRFMEEWCNSNNFVQKLLSLIQEQKSPSLFQFATKVLQQMEEVQEVQKYGKDKKADVYKYVETACKWLAQLTREDIRLSFDLKKFQQDLKKMAIQDVGNGIAMTRLNILKVIAEVYFCLRNIWEESGCDFINVCVSIGSYVDFKDEWIKVTENAHDNTFELIIIVQISKGERQAWYPLSNLSEWSARTIDSLKKQLDFYKEKAGLKDKINNIADKFAAANAR